MQRQGLSAVTSGFAFCMSVSFLAAVAQREFDLQGLIQISWGRTDFEMLPDDVLLAVVTHLVRIDFRHRADEAIKAAVSVCTRNRLQWTRQPIPASLLQKINSIEVHKICSSSRRHSYGYKPFQWLSLVSKRMRIIVDSRELLQRPGALASAVIIQQHTRSFIEWRNYNDLMDSYREGQDY
jgi:hypothetical protein